MLSSFFIIFYIFKWIVFLIKMDILMGIMNGEKSVFNKIIVSVNGIFFLYIEI